MVSEDEAMAEIAVGVDFKDSETADTTGKAVDIVKSWPEFIEALLRDRPKLGSFLSLASVSCTSHIVDLRFLPAFNFQFKELNKNQTRDEIIGFLNSFFGKKFDLRMTLESESDAETEGKNYFNQMNNVPLTINDEIEREPIIQTILDMFDGEIIE